MQWTIEMHVIGEDLWRNLSERPMGAGVHPRRLDKALGAIQKPFTEVLW